MTKTADSLLSPALLWAAKHGIETVNTGSDIKVRCPRCAGLLFVHGTNLWAFCYDASKRYDEGSRCNALAENEAQLDALFEPEKPRGP